MGKRLQSVRRTTGQYRRAIRELLAIKGRRVRSSRQRTHVAEIEVLVKDSLRARGQILLDSLRRHFQAPLFQRRDCLVVFGGRLLQAHFLGEEEKSLVSFAVVNTGKG